MDQALERLNSLSAEAAEVEFNKCCGSIVWSKKMAAARPFATASEMISIADDLWWALGADDWLEAFRAHPKIGERKAAAQITIEAQKWSQQEQPSIGNARQETTQALAELNQTYEDRFGYIYIVCATGKSSEELLAILKDRLNNDPEAELRTAAAEQAKITQLRLKKLLGSLAMT